MLPSITNIPNLPELTAGVNVAILPFMPEAKKKRLNLYVPDNAHELMKDLRHVAIDLGCTINETVFLAIREYVDRHKAKPHKK